MKEAELRKYATCAKCGKKVGHTGLPFFWTITLNRYGVDMRAVQAQDGLGAFLGNSYLAQVMGPNQDLAKPVMDTVSVALCEDCACDRVNIAALAEAANKESEGEI